MARVFWTQNLETSYTKDFGCLARNKAKASAPTLMEVYIEVFMIKINERVVASCSILMETSIKVCGLMI
jgi:hypothetical protein